ncbi:erythrocyte membrane protein 1, PfEMP1, putative [Plasmodium sp. DRC-Itaito]|nr:erythrocyte membrane protein 1, PfEMP1, putative [Plasmodium sp. DRC-Itaito]
MAPEGGRGGTDDAKHVLDEIGQNVYSEVHKDAKNYEEQLKGNLQRTSSNEETIYTTDTCQLVNDYYKKVDVNNQRYPCRTGKEGEDVNRFSDTLGGQCTKEKISGSTNKSGACAPFRRLHLCDHNLESINTTEIKNKNDLLAEVCLATLHEGQSIEKYHSQHQANNPGCDSQLCTVLARSFADIGDIIRGKDLYLGNPQEKKQREKLDKNLKDIFRKIHAEVTKNNRALEERYNDKENYYQLREDWWDANRETVWKAITCGADTGNAYFRPTCDKGDEKGPEQAHDKCRCGRKNNGKPNPDPPTFFDYVPQYLRWFEEWAEDFCRKKKRKLQDLEKECRDYEKKRYCSGNGYDCTKTVYKKGKIVISYQCTKCSVLCRLYEKWVDNEKKEFIKQRGKYTKEILDTGRSQRGIRNNNNYEEYGKKFYEIFKRTYKEDDAFLKLLNNEDVCKNINYEKEKIDFTQKDDNVFHKNINNKGTFYHSEYCEVCPGCGMKRKRDGSKEWKQKSDGQCDSEKHYNIDAEAMPTNIDVISFGDKLDEIRPKIDTYCDEDGGNKQELHEKWKCYESKYVHEERKKDEEDEDEEDDDNDPLKTGGICTLENKNKNKGRRKQNEIDPQEEPEELQKTFNDFFYFWIGRFLNDSIEWRNKVRKCLNSESQTCKSGCKKDCDCFLKWVKQKEQEWGTIKQHFKTQGDIGHQNDLGYVGPLGTGATPDFILNYLSNLKEILKNIQDAYGKSKKTEHIRKMLDEETEATPGGASVTEKEITLDELLQHEKTDAEKCKECKDPPPQPEGGAGRSDSYSPNGPKRVEEDEDEEEQSDTEEPQEENEDRKGETDQAVTTIQHEETSSPEGDAVSPIPPPPSPEVTPACDIVNKLFTEGNPQKDFKDACTQKYGGNNARLGWKCVTSDKPGSASVADGRLARAKRDLGSAATGASGKDGAICVPPRRRKLYLHTPLPGEAVTGEATEEGQADTAPTETDLRDWFVKSAAVETYFLWHNFKEQKKREKKEEEGAGSDALEQNSLEAAKEIEQELQKKLENEGKIPDDFKRQLFYTLGDYRDILFGKTHIFIKTTGNGTTKDEMLEKESKIRTAIDSLFPNSDTSPGTRGISPPSEKPNSKREKLWDTTLGKSIWDGMLCALTYNTDGSKDKIEKIESTNGDLFQKLKNGNEYDNVIFKGGFDDGTGNTGPLRTHDGPNAGKTTQTKLSTFVKRPFFFRWLEEWANEFCRKRIHKLDIIEKECRGTDGDKKCSGDGLRCDEKIPKNEEIYKGLLCRSCGNSCSSYRRWIERKKEEYDKQEKEYSQQKENCVKEDESAQKNDDGNEFCTKLKENYTDAKTFLDNLQGAPCKSKKDNEKDSGVDEIEFDDNTFKHTEKCDPCSTFKIECKNGHCAGVPNGKKCDGKTSIGAADIKPKVESGQQLYMHVSDKSKQTLEEFRECHHAGIFRGIRKDQWKCDDYCGVDMCILEQTGEEIVKDSDKKPITMQELVKRWLEYFFEDYNRINNKIKTCTTNSDGCKCIKGCVVKWAQGKRTEWKKIKENYLVKYNVDQDSNDLTNFLETLIGKTDVKKATGLDSLSAFVTSCHCNGSVSSDTSKKDDIINCLLDKLEKDVEKCPTPSGDQHSTCENSPPEPDVEEEEPEEPPDGDQTEEAQKKNMMPIFCEKVVSTTTETAAIDNKCEPASPLKPNPQEEEEEKEEEKDKGDEQDTSTSSNSNDEQGPSPVPSDEQTPESGDQAESTEATETEHATPETPAPETPQEKYSKPSNPLAPPKKQEPPPPKLRDVLLPSAFPWTVGVAFVALTYWALLKKKSTRPVDLFSVLDIPKGDYDIPTKLSSNRYVPYGTGKHRGKRYIYIEGDSDSGHYYEDTTDITSSSESEYEEIDMHIPHSPKYKTLIEVVLEPSTSGKNAPNSDNTIPTSDIPSPFTDEEWNTIKDEFISNMLQNKQKDMPNNYVINGNSPTNTQPNHVGDNSYNNTHPNTLYDNVDQKPFIMSIHDRNLLSGEEYNYDMINSGIYGSTSNPNQIIDNPSSYSGNVGSYSGIDLINDALSRQPIDIYDEILKRKENELFGTENTKHITSKRVSKPAHEDPLHNQLNLFHQWLDRHRNMCDKWDNKVDILHKLKEEWNKDNNSSDIPSSNKTLNTDVSIKIHMDSPKPKKEFTNMDTNPNNSSMDSIIDDLEKYNESYCDIYEDDIYYDVNGNDTSTVNRNNMEKPTKIQIEMDVNNHKVVKEKYPIADIWDI